MKKSVRTICLIAVLVPLLACGKKRVIDPVPPPSPSATQPSAAEPDPPPPPTHPEPEPEPEPQPEPDPAVEPEPIDWLASGEEAYLGGSYDKAIDFYVWYLKDNPEAPQRDHAHYRLGLLAAWKNDYSTALREFKTVRLDSVGEETRIQVTLLIRLLEKAARDAEEMKSLKNTLNDIMKKLDS